MLSVKSPRDKTSAISKHVSKCTEVLLFIGVTDPFDIAGLYLRAIFVNHVCISDAFLSNDTYQLGLRSIHSKKNIRVTVCSIIYNYYYDWEKLTRP